MKRIHLHFSVVDLNEAIRYYTALLGAAPSVRKPDYAKWLLEDPGLNLAVSSGSAAPGLRHLGIQVDCGKDLEGIRTRLADAEVGTNEEQNAHCCYARSDKVWSRDPSGMAWESFLTFAAEEERDGPASAATQVSERSCCA